MINENLKSVEIKVDELENVTGGTDTSKYPVTCKNAECQKIYYINLNDGSSSYTCPYCNSKIRIYG